MKQSVQKRPLSYLLLLLTLVVIGLGFWFLAPSSDERPAQTELTEKSEANSSDVPVVAKTEKANLPVQTPVIDEVEHETEENPFLEAETKARLVQIADTFAEDMQYPVFSTPIRNHDELQKYLPNSAVAASLPLDSKNENSPQISLKTSKLQYFRGEQILAEAFVAGPIHASNISVEARLVNSGQILLEADAQSSSSDSKRYRINMDSLALPDNIDSSELRLIASFDIDGARYEIGSPIKYVKATSSIEYVGPSQVMDSVLQIPVYVSTSEPGFHQISAILYNAETGQPLVHLNAEKDLLVERDMIPLQAHIVALKAGGHEGPYLLKNFSLTRMPAEPDFTTRYGRVPVKAVNVDGYSFSDYRDEPYVDEEAQERLEFLKKLGGEA